jgi:choice-of-anchor A domain-containing protein
MLYLSVALMLSTALTAQATFASSRVSRPTSRSIESFLFQKRANTTREFVTSWPWEYPASACIGELWYTPLAAWWGDLSGYYWSDFNLVAFGDVQQTSTSSGNAEGIRVDGRLAAMGSLRVFTEGSIGHNTLTPGEHPFAVVTGDDFSFYHGNIHPKTENIFVGGEVSIPCNNGESGECTPQYLVNRVRASCHDWFKGDIFGFPVPSNCLSLSFFKAYTYYKTVQTLWANHPLNCINELRTEWGGVTLIVTAAVQNQKRYYIRIPQDVFSKLNNFQLLGFPEDAEFVVTIDASGDLTFDKVGKWPTLTGAFPGRVVYNVLTSGTITIRDSRLPSLLAPDATIVQESGRVEGFLIARNVQSLGTVYNVDCNLGVGERKRDLRQKFEVSV